MVAKEDPSSSSQVLEHKILHQRKGHCKGRPGRAECILRTQKAELRKKGLNTIYCEGMSRLEHPKFVPNFWMWRYDNGLPKTRDRRTHSLSAWDLRGCVRCGVLSIVLMHCGMPAKNLWCCPNQITTHVVAWSKTDQVTTHRVGVS